MSFVGEGEDHLRLEGKAPAHSGFRVQGLKVPMDSGCEVAVASSWPQFKFNTCYTQKHFTCFIVQLTRFFKLQNQTVVKQTSVTSLEWHQ